MQVYPIYVLVDQNGNRCPNLESPLNLFNPEIDGEWLLEEVGIPTRYLTGLIGPWVQKRLAEYDGDITKFKVRKLYPSKLEQIGIAKTEPGDENNQDISALVGKVDISKLDRYSQDDADAYSFSGGLCKAEQGLLEFVEMFKARINVLNPLLTATQESNYMGTEAIPAIPFNGLVLAHSNETEWSTFKNNKSNEAFLDRIYIVKVPYCLRVTEEMLIYKKLLQRSSLQNAPCAPYTLKMLAQFIVLSRLSETETSAPYTKLRVYDGEDVKSADPHAKPLEEYREDAGIDEGMTGLSTRTAFKILSRVFNFDPSEVAANPVHLMYILQKVIDESQFDEETTTQYEYALKNVLQANYKDIIGKEIQTAYLESYTEYGQNLFNRYLMYAEAWVHDTEYRDPDTGQRLDRQMLNEECEKIEKAGGVGNPKDFRQEVVTYALRYYKANGEDLAWTKYAKMKDVIEARMFSKIEDILPIISFSSKGNKDEDEKHAEFVQRMVNLGYTEKQVRLLVEWHLRVSKSS
jgi:serine protein kinase